MSAKSLHASVSTGYPANVRNVTSSLSFLGFVISPEDISMDPDCISAITEWPALTGVHDIQVFLGFADFYHRFVDGVSRPITFLLRKRRFHWSHQAQSASDELKRRFTSAPIL